MGYYINTNKSRVLFWNMLGVFSTISRGVEVTFHPNGYPAHYRTIIRNRLFGRQIEWNDKGEVVSDVDLDIPKTWADASKEPQKDE